MNQMRPICASVITIGDELLIGQRTDTNSQWLCSELNKIGATVIMKLSIRDEEIDIQESLDMALSKSDIVLITGGLGPTKDDITKKTLASYFKSELITDNTVLQDVTDYFLRRGKEMNPVQNAQALVPSNSTVIRNHKGTAPGMWFDLNDKITVSMPGVPFEMKHMMRTEVLNKLQKRFHLNQIIHKTISTVGIGESSVAELISDIENSLPTNIKMAYLPTAGAVKVRLSGINVDESTISNLIQEISDRLDKYVYALGDVAFEDAIGNLIQKSKLTISVAESCTGGYLSHLVTKIPGCSAYFIGGIIAYSNQIKREQLGVNPTTLEKHGAVSKNTVIEMAENVRKKFKTSIGLATSGIAGPGGATDDKPVGTVWVACATEHITKAKLLHLTNDRIQNIELSAIAVLDLLRQSL